jgi:hypothetical protein
MKEVDIMATEFNPSDVNRPVTFNLPDDDQVQLIPWGYVLERLQANLETTLGYLSSTNTYLSNIDTKLQYWIDQQEQGG